MIKLRCNKDSIGRFLTHAMFFETRIKASGYEPTFTLKEQDHTYEDIDYVSMRRLYLEMEDPTEYEFAITTLGSWDHWQRLCNSAAIFEHISRWREELETKVRAKAIKAMISTATNDGAKGTTAAKWLATAGWKEGKGRPSKAKVKGELKKAAQVVSLVSEDASRLGLK